MDIKPAGFKNHEEFFKSLRHTENENIYKIELRYYSADPRIQLREKTKLTVKNFLVLKKELERLDKLSKKGYRTEKILIAIKDNPHKKAAELALLTGIEKDWLKLNIRKLKNLGLTISHEVGYELSPLGKIFVKKLMH